MHFQKNTLDDLMIDVFKELLSRPFDVKASRGISSEIFGCLIELTNPRARLSRTETKGKPFSALGEFLWYFSRDNALDFIKYYLPNYEENSDDGKTVHGGYGPRLFNMRGQNQVENVINLLKSKSSSRRAVIQLFNAEDIADSYKEIPCTCTLQFSIRNDKLNMFTSMRSNDAFWGLPHDVFSFTLLQELISRELGIDLGTYFHAVGSLHLYEDKIDAAKGYIGEGIQSTILMDPMPKKEPLASLQTLLSLESSIRTSEEITMPENLDQYWQDLAYLLLILKKHKEKDYEAIKILKSNISSRIYDAYIDDKLTALEKK